VCGRGALGRWRPATATSTLPRPTATNPSVGRALRDSGLPREVVFITTKFYPGRRDPEAEVQRSLERLGVDSVDLYIIHWPQGGPRWAWDGMQRAYGGGYARSIGVSNFGASDLQAVLEVADVPPVINQVQFSPFAFRRALLEACDRHGVALEAYSPLGTEDMGRWTGSTAPAAPTAASSGPGGERAGAAPGPWLPPPKVPASWSLTGPRPTLTAA
jgi:diketogulonate reductase-like aldo/keto reductase